MASAVVGKGRKEKRAFSAVLSPQVTVYCLLQKERELGPVALLHQQHRAIHALLLKYQCQRL